MAAEIRMKATSHPSEAKVNPRASRLLLALWFLGGREVNQGEVTKRVKLKQEKSSDCQKIFAQLEKDGAIEIASKKVSITDEGKRILSQGLKTSDLAIEGTVVGSWMAKALLKWLQQSEVIVNGTATNGKTIHTTIAAYKEFEQVVLEHYDHLNRNYNLNNLVPIYRIRREIGDRVSRSQFNEWMLDLQANDILQLIGGEMPSLTPDIAEDSIETKLGGVRYYVKRL